MSARMALASSSSSSESSASMREETATASAPIACGVLGHGGRDAVVALVDVGDEQHRLGGERVQVAQRVGRVGGYRHGARRAARLQRGDDLGHPALLGLRLLVAAAGLLGHALQAALGLLEVGVEQLGLDRLDVAGAGRRRPRGAPRWRRGGRARRGRWRRPRGCWPGTGCPAPRPRGRRARGRRCRGSRSCRGRRSRPRWSPRPARRRSSTTGTTATLGSMVVNG